MKDTLLYIIQGIVDNPDKVKIDETDSEGIVQFTVSVDQADMGKIIGKEGKIIRAIRNVMKVPAIKQGLRINVALFDQLNPVNPQETQEVAAE